MQHVIGTECILYDRLCTGCGECDMCDLDPEKVCDNCGKCLDLGDYSGIMIDAIITEPSGAKGDGKENK
ncbi:MAG: hypothetical protein LUD47_03610 [Clostridia bacterium]|nr:hypothetical protein [Clostridia bacterium]